MVTYHKKIKRTDLTNDLNTVRNNIQSLIVWYDGFLPRTSLAVMPVNYQSAMGSREIQGVSENSFQTLGSAATFNSILTNMLNIWSCVRVLYFTTLYRSHWGNRVETAANMSSLTTNNYVGFNWVASGQDGLSTTRAQPYTDNIYSQVEATNKPTTGALFEAQKINTLLQQCYSKWRAWPSVSYTYQWCHSSCHYNCHGSGGSR